MARLEKDALLTRLTDIDNAAFGALQELHKCKHVSNTVQSYYDYRSDQCDGSNVKIPWSEEEKIVILTGYNEAAMDSDIVHDYILTAIRAAQHVHLQLERLREDAKLM